MEQSMDRRAKIRNTSLIAHHPGVNKLPCIKSLTASNNNIKNKRRNKEKMNTQKNGHNREAHGTAHKSVARERANIFHSLH